MSSPAKLVTVDNSCLCLVPDEDTGSKDVTVPLVSFRSIPVFLSNRDLVSWSNVSRKRPRDTQSDTARDLAVQEESLQDLMGIKPLRKNHGSCPIPNGEMIQIYAKKDSKFLMIHGDSQLEIANTSGYWTADFCGVGGYHQVLWLPRFSLEMKEWDVEVAKNALMEILNQCVLTDGSYVNLSPDASISTVHNPTLKDCTVISPRTVSYIPIRPASQTTAPEEATTETESAWSRTIAGALQKRLVHERTQVEKSARTREMQPFLVKKNQDALQALLNPQGGTVEVLRLRNRTWPGESKDETRSVTIFMQVDVMTPNASSPLHNLHLSCTPTTTKITLSVRTHSGIVPQVRQGTCITVTALVMVSGIEVPKDTSSKWSLSLGIESHWTTNGAVGESEPRRATRVAVLSLPMETLLVAQPEFHTVQLSNETTIPPTEIYECRKPHRLKVDVTRVSCDWNEWTKSLNDGLRGTGHHVDVIAQRGSAHVVIVMFAFPEKDLSVLMAIVQSHLPSMAVVTTN